MLRTDRKYILTAWVLLATVLPLSSAAQTVTKIVGSNGTTIADVKPANTAPLATDKALVVTISPNSPSPAGSQDVNLIKVGGAAIAIGQATMAASLPVAIASNQSAIAITSATLATEATLSALNAKFGTLGQKTMAGSAPVVIASDQSAITVQGASADNSTNSSAKIPTLAGLANAANPTWTEGNQVPLSSDLTGNLRTVGSAVVATSAPTYINGQTSPLSLTTGGALRVQAIGSEFTPASIDITARDVSSTSTTGQNSQVIITGSPTANSTATFALNGISTIRVQLTGTWTGTMRSELSMDGGTTWYIIGVHITGGPVFTSTFTANGQGNLNVGSATHYRIRSTAAQTGTVTVLVTESAQLSSVYVANAIKIVDGTTGGTQQAVVSTSAPASNVSGLAVRPVFQTQGSTTSGQTGPLSQGAVTTAAPSYTTGQTSPLSLTTAGALRVDASASTQPVSGTVTVVQPTASNLNAAVVGIASDNSTNSTAKLPVIAARANAAAPTWTEGNQAPLSVDLSGRQRTDVSSWLGSTAPSVGQKANASSLPVTLSSDQVGTAGTAAAGVQTIQGIASMTPVQVSQATASNLNAQVVGAAANGAVVSGNPVLGGGSDGTNARTIRTDTSGNQIVVGAAISCSRISTNVTTQNLRTGSGSLISVSFNPGATSAATLYDSTGAASGQIISFTTAAPAQLYGLTFAGPYGIPFTNGLTITTTGGTPAELQVCWKTI